MSDPYDMEPPITASRRYQSPDSLPLAYEEELSRERGIRWPRRVVNAGFVAYGIMVLLGLLTGTWALMDAIPLVPILAYVAYRMAQRIARLDDDPGTGEMIFAAFWAKMIGTLVRAAVVSFAYSNRSDATTYHQFGKPLAPMFRTLDFSQAGPWSGTDFMKNLTGVVYSFTGASEVSGAVVMAFLSFLGGVLMWRAFKLAVPTGAVRRYGLLVLFLPTMLYWPSSLGKEGWAIFCLGVASYGVAKVMTGRIGNGVVLVALGLWGLTMLRPHVAITVFCGIALAGLVGKPRGDVGKSSLLRIVLFGVLLAVGGYLSTSTAEFFGVPSLNQETINEQLANAEGRTQEAGSVFTPFPMTNPVNTPLAFATVLFRPFPIEASSGIALASSLEGVFLLVLTWKSRSRLRSLFRSMRREPYSAYCLGVLITLVYAFSSFSNFGILSRQRAQALPFFLALLCLPVWHREGVLPTEEAIAARDESAPPDFDEPPVDPYRNALDPQGHDPYAGHDAGADPYRRP
jgi:hypothetical protein